MLALIAGGGIGGLALAVALRRRGIDAQVFERAPSRVACGVAQTLWPNGIRALSAIDLDTRTVAAAWPLTTSTVRDHRGRTLAATDVSRVAREAGAPAVCIRRASLHQILADAASPGIVHEGIACTGFTQTPAHVTLELGDGSRYEGDILVGADGLWSRIRAGMQGDARPRRLGHTLWRAIVPFRDPHLRAGNAFETWARGLRFGAIQVDADSVYWYAAANAPPREQNAAVTPDEVQLLATLFRHWHDPIPALLAAADADSIVRADIFDRPALGSWVRGRVALLGDAAHPMTPDLGQGACQAIEDAVILADCLDAKEPACALRAYERRRHHRACGIAAQSHRMTRIAQWSTPTLCFLRDALARATPAAALERGLRRMVAPDGA